VAGLALAMGGAAEQAVYDREMRRKRSATNELQQRIGYQFTDPNLLECALTHSSALAGGSRVGSYQRLEFLGDHVLGLAIAELLFQTYPKASEGELSRRLAALVRQETCADIAREMDLGPALRLGNAESHAGGRRKTAILADVCESVIGAVYLDGGYPAAFDLVRRYWAELLAKTESPARDAKTLLQEWAQGNGLPAPIYVERERKGPHHRPQFRVAVELPDREPAEGTGRSKRAAEQAAAAAMLERDGIPRDAANA
jgi:ribonuclease III